MVNAVHVRVCTCREVIFIIWIICLSVTSDKLSPKKNSTTYNQELPAVDCETKSEQKEQRTHPLWFTTVVLIIEINLTIILGHTINTITYQLRGKVASCIERMSEVYPRSWKNISEL